jgi:hypothetical protein
MQLAARSEFATSVVLMRINTMALQLTASASFRENTLRGAVYRTGPDLKAHFPFSTSIAYNLLVCVCSYLATDFTIL